MQWCPTPTCNQIAFRRQVVAPAEGVTGIYLVDTSGGDPVQLTTGGSDPEWKPDGKAIVFDDTGIATVPATGGTPTHLTNDGNDGMPAWSPDRTTILYSHYFGGTYVLHSMSPTGAGDIVVRPYAALVDWQPLTKFRLTVHKSGFGTVTSAPGSISCPSVCSRLFLAGTKVTLTAKPNPGAGFSHWTGCQGNPSPSKCVVQMSRPRIVTATFKAGGARPQPDALIGLTSTTLAGDGVYNTTGQRQAKRSGVSKGGSTAFFLEFQNDGNRQDTILVRGPGSSGAFSLGYLKAGKNVTDDVVAGTFACAKCAPGGKVKLRLVVAAKRSAPSGAKTTLVLTASSKATPAKKEVVKAVVTVR